MPVNRTFRDLSADKPARAAASTDEPEAFEAPIGTDPIRLDRRLIQTVERALKQRLPIKNAAWCAGISAGTLSTWLADGAREDCTDPLKRELFRRCSVARGNQTAWVIRKYEDLVDAGGAGALGAMDRIAAALDPETFGKNSTQRVEVQHSEAPTGSKMLEGLTLDQKRQMRELLVAGQLQISAGGSSTSDDAEG